MSSTALDVYDPATGQFNLVNDTPYDAIVEDVNVRPFIYPLAVLLCLATIIALLALLFAWLVLAVRKLQDIDEDSELIEVIIVGQNDTLNTTIIGPLGNDQPADQCVCVTLPDDQPPIPVIIGDETLNTTIVGPLGVDNPSDECVCVTLPTDQLPIPVLIADDTVNTTIVGPLGSDQPSDECVCVTLPTDQFPIPVVIADAGPINVTIVIEPVQMINATCSIESPIGNNLTSDECVCMTVSEDQPPIPVSVENPIGAHAMNECMCVTLPTDQEPIPVSVENPIGAHAMNECMCVTLPTDQEPIPVVFDASAFNFTFIVPPFAAVTIVDPIGSDILSNDSVSVTFASDQPPIPITFRDGLIDPFGRFKVSQPSAIFDNKLLSAVGDTTHWDSAQVSGSGTTYTYSQARASVTLGVAATTAGLRVRQTIRVMNYQPGRSQTILMTLVPGASGSGITKRWGYFDQGDGLFFQLADGVFSVVLRSNITGTPTDTVVPQGSFDEAMPAGWSLANAVIYGIDFQWLGVGDARFFIMCNETFSFFHTFRGCNAPHAYMSSPNLPVRFELQNSGAGAAATLECICVTVYAEGGDPNLGIEFSANRGSTLLTLTTDGADHSSMAIRKTPGSRHTHAGVVGITSVSPSGNSIYIWKLFYRPTVAGAALTWQSLSGSNVQFAVPVVGNTLTGGIVTASGYISATNQASPVSASSPQTLFLGSLIDGTSVEYHFSIRRLDTTGGSTDYLASMTFMEV